MKANIAQQRAALAFHVGDNVRIERVAFPDVPHHAVFIGASGIVERIIKTNGEVVVMTHEHGRRYCSPENLTAAEGRTS